MGKCGAFMLQNLVTMVKRSRAKGSPLYRGEPEGSEVKDSIVGLVNIIQDCKIVCSTHTYIHTHT